MKKFIIAFKHDQLSLTYLEGKFLELPEVKFKEGFFVGLLIHLMVDNEFEAAMSEIELEAWKNFKGVCASHG